MKSAIRAVVGRSAKLGAKLAQAQIEGAMTYKVRITRGGNATPTWNAATKQVENPAGTLIWGPESVDPHPGVARVRSVSGPVTMALGDEPQYFQSTFISIPLRAPQPNVDDVVVVLDGPDAKMVMRAYRVVDVVRGGLMPVCHELQVVGIEPAATWRQP